MTSIQATDYEAKLKAEQKAAINSKIRAIVHARVAAQSQHFDVSTNSCGRLGTFVKTLIDLKIIPGNFLKENEPRSSQKRTWIQYIKDEKDRIGRNDNRSCWRILVTEHWPIKGEPTHPVLKEIHQAGYSRQEIWSLLDVNNRQVGFRGKGRSDLKTYLDYLNKWEKYLNGQKNTRSSTSAENFRNALPNFIHQNKGNLSPVIRKTTTIAAWTLTASAIAVVAYRFLG